MPEILDLTPEYGLNVTYEFKNDVHETFMGRDYINARWCYPVAKYNFQVAFFAQSVYEYIKDFFLFVEGGENTFLFRDPCNDYCTSPGTEQMGLQIQGTFVDRGDGTFQLCKQWKLGDYYYVKPIHFPENITIFQSDFITPVTGAVIGNNGVVTGVNATMGWIGTFYTLVRFENDSVPQELLSFNQSSGETLYQIPDLRLIEIKAYFDIPTINLTPNYTHIFQLSFPINSQINLMGKTDIFISDSGHEARDALDTYKRDINFSYTKINFHEQQYLLGLWLITLGGWGTFQIADLDLDFGYNVRFAETISFSSIVQPINTTAVSFGLEDILFKADNIVLKEEVPNSTKSNYCQIWKVTRQDGTEQGFTNHDRLITYNTLDYPSVFGFSGTSSQRTAELSTDSTEMTGVFGSDDYTTPDFYPLFIMEEDLILGKYDNASVVVEVYDWLSNTVISTQFRGTIGGYTVGYIADKAKQYQIEVQSIIEKLDVNVSAETSSECRHKFLSQGYGRCNLAPTPDNTTNINLPQIKGTISAVNSTSEILVSSPATDNWEGFKYGTVRFLTGKLAGTEVYIINTSSPNAIVFLYALPITPAVGDEVRLTKPCNKSTEACNNFGNIANYGGFPRLPGIDNLVSGAET